MNFIRREEEKEEDNDLDVDPLVTVREAQKYVETLRRFFMQKRNKNSLYDKLILCILCQPGLH